MTTDIEIERQKTQTEAFEGEFKPTAEQLAEICERGSELLENASDAGLRDYSE